MKHQPLNKRMGHVGRTSQTPLTINPQTIHTVWHDPFIDELHQTRRKLLAKAGNKLHSVNQNARQTAIAKGFVVKANPS
jgi:hypothetical protein